MIVSRSGRVFTLLDREKLKSLFNSKSCFRTTTIRQLFWESDPKGGYKSKNVTSRVQLIKDGFSELKNELILFGKECFQKLESDPVVLYQPGLIDKQWELHKKEHLDQWITTCDSDHGEGFSSCELTINNSGNGLFSGCLSTQVPKDGVIKRAGYCSVRTKRVRKSFKRDAYLNWGQYTHLVIKCRGDGRSYMLNIATSGYFDQLWNDIYHYVLYTRGGPYWQITKVPFSKFFFSSKGRIQDIQERVQLNKITHFGITASDKINGPFSLEIDYIGLEYDPLHMEEFAYEKYKLPKNIAAN
ncbi:complex I intermediate-associated protein 30 [Rhodnius prolixus]|uniref:Putative motochondrial complex i intermediate-associated protein 30 cia30 n=2 Tax=Rhodnius TaxID=13248 RepID=R4FL81_RHOPR